MDAAWDQFAESLLGNHKAARRAFQAAEDLGPIYSGLGGLDSSMGYFEKAIAKADPFTLYPGVFPVYFNLHKHPRFIHSRRALRLADDNADSFIPWPSPQLTNSSEPDE